MSDFGIPLPSNVSADDMAAAIEAEMARRSVESSSIPFEDVEPEPDDDAAGDEPESDDEQDESEDAEPDIEEDADEDAEPEPEPEPATQPPALTPGTYQVPGIDVPLTDSDVRQLFELGRYFANLTPEQAAQIDAIVSGQPAPQPQQYPQSQQQLQQQQYPQQYEDDDLDPATAERLRVQQEELARMRAEMEQLRQPLVAQEHERIVAEQQRHLAMQQRVADEFAARYELSAQEVEQVWTTVAQMGIVGSAAQRYGGNIEALYRDVFTAGLNSHPSVSEKVLEKRVADRMTQVKNDDKKRKASASTAGSGGVPRRAPQLPQVKPTATIAEQSAGLAAALKQMGVGE